MYNTWIVKAYIQFYSPYEQKNWNFIAYLYNIQIIGISMHSNSQKTRYKKNIKILKFYSSKKKIIENN